MPHTIITDRKKNGLAPPVPAFMRKAANKLPLPPLMNHKQRVNHAKNILNNPVVNPLSIFRRRKRR